MRAGVCSGMGRNWSSSLPGGMALRVDVRWAACHQPAFDVEVVDTTGAGDVYHGAFLVGYLRVGPLRTIMAYASATAALKCTRVGGREGSQPTPRSRRFWRRAERRSRNDPDGRSRIVSLNGVETALTGLASADQSQQDEQHDSADDRYDEAGVVETEVERITREELDEMPPTNAPTTPTMISTIQPYRSFVPASMLATQPANAPKMIHANQPIVAAPFLCECSIPIR